MRSLPASPRGSASNARGSGLALPPTPVSIVDALFLLLVSTWLTGCAGGAGSVSSGVLVSKLGLLSIAEREETTDEAAPDEEEARRSWGVPTSVILGWRGANEASAVGQRTLESLHHAGAVG